MITDCAMTAVLWNASMVSSAMTVMLWDAMMDFSAVAVMLWNATKVFRSMTAMWRDTSMTIMLWNAKAVFPTVTVTLWYATTVFTAMTMILWDAMKVFSVERSAISRNRHAANILNTMTCSRFYILRLSSWRHLACVHRSYIWTPYRYVGVTNWYTGVTLVHYRHS